MSSSGRPESVAPSTVSHGGAEINVVPLAPVPDAKDMVKAASRQAASGLRARGQGEHDDAALHLGIMIELLAKAYLVSLNPALIAEDKSDFANVVRVTGHGHRLVKLEPMKTIGVEVALTRIGLLHQTNGDLRELSTLLRPLGQARNGAAHVGRAGVDPDVVAQIAVRGAELLLPLLGLDLTAFFDDYADAAEALLDERATVLQRTLELRIARAREVFEQRFGQLPVNDDQKAAFGLIDVTALVDDEHQLWDCPACLQKGILSGEARVEFDIETDWDDGAQFSYVAGADMTLFARRFSCPYCGMVLAGYAELDCADVPAVHILRTATEEDLEADAEVTEMAE